MEKLFQKFADLKPDFEKADAMTLYYGIAKSMNSFTGGKHSTIIIEEDTSVKVVKRKMVAVDPNPTPDQVIGDCDGCPTNAIYDTGNYARISDEEEETNRVEVYEQVFENPEGQFEGVVKESGELKKQLVNYTVDDILTMYPTIADLRAQLKLLGVAYTKQDKEQTLATLLAAHLNSL